MSEEQEDWAEAARCYRQALELCLRTGMEQIAKWPRSRLFPQSIRVGCDLLRQQIKHPSIYTFSVGRRLHRELFMERGRNAQIEFA
ncbi:hypothetical protein P0N66_11640 [Desulfurivibrio alkaliphilus]|nr:hypothetical protein [Desulfurivibrio alkaliphilus]MDF1615604.1 hypothetical protein [Desulfurivibrio alkaliphilus]